MISVYKSTVNDAYKVDLNKMGLTFLSFNVQSLQPLIEKGRLQGVDGEYRVSNQFGGREILAKLYLRATDNDDFQNKKTDVYRLFNGKQELLMVDDRLVNKKIWRVVTESDYELNNDQTAYTQEFSLTFVSESPYAYDDNVTTIAQGGDTFYIDNKGDVELDAREHMVTIDFKGVSDKLRIVNETNGAQWQYLGGTTATDTIRLDSIYPYKNGRNIFSDTNYGVIKLNKGTNKFKVFGSDNFEINFRFKELYI